MIIIIGLSGLYVKRAPSQQKRGAYKEGDTKDAVKKEVCQGN